MKESCENTIKKLYSIKQSFTSRFSKLDKNVIKPLERLEHFMDHLYNRTNQMIISTNEEFRNMNQLINSLITQTKSLEQQIKNIEILMKVLCHPNSTKDNKSSSIQAGTTISDQKSSKFFVRESEYSEFSLKKENHSDTSRKIEYEIEEFQLESLKPVAKISIKKNSS